MDKYLRTALFSVHTVSVSSIRIWSRLRLVYMVRVRRIKIACKDVVGKMQNGSMRKVKCTMVVDGMCGTLLRNGG